MKPLRAAVRGFSMLSLLVGLLVSSVVSVALLTQFGASVKAGAAARLDTAADDQVVTALLRAQLAVQDAGYGIDGAAYGTQLRVLSGASLSAGTLSGTAVAAGSSGNALVWALRTGSQVQCAGLLFNAATDGSGGLSHLGPVLCTDVSGWSSASWTASTWVASPAAQPARPISFVATSATCVPFGMAALSGTLRLTIHGASATGLALSDSQCLANFRS